MTDQDVLDALEFTPDYGRCECVRCGLDEDHPAHDGGCANPAKYRVEMHMIDKCNQPGLTESGGVIFFVCERCMLIGERVAARIAAANQRLIKERNFRLMCTTCQRPLNDPHNIMEVEPMDE
ncbi:Uncharacterised protein [Mycobacteroides abscessus subsp. bolletii]|uniref:hypothetical protein n=1 Tax=Mycobacteroides abscessus TaxID=36809 RepID=UPI0009A7B960|nr:hypothetical protein [Mycobacteroides abscessus]SKR94512.1 Uncharacterised protein [Mycobacteroides abscessus subsp. bolletii]SKS03016.1 Uncharacterised protein [Mycobacteroides abscessus subsp. bolletii]DAZ90130.1 TPA_asm: hypothetical protein PROPHIFVLQ01-1_43 [Mycobacterium phage prophiFVLQ01-1]